MTAKKKGGKRSKRQSANAAANSAANSAGNSATNLVGARELAAADLRWTCKPLKPSRRAPSVAFLLEQERPMAALRTGLSIPASGYHLFVSGLIGSGRTAVVDLLLRDMRPGSRRVPDRVYLHGFREPNRPLLVSLPAGRAAAFRDELEDLGHGLQNALLSALRSRPHRMSRRVVLRATGSRDRRIMDALQRQAQKQGCALVRFQSQSGASTADIYPVVEGEPVTLDALSALVIEGKLPEDERERLLKSREQLLDRLEEVNDRVRSEHARVARELREMDRKLAWNVWSANTADFMQRWPQREVADWLDAAGEFVERHLSRFLGSSDEDGEEETALPDAGVPPEGSVFDFAAAVVKTSLNDSSPVVIETNPTWVNLFGTITAPPDGSPPGPRHIHPGAVLRADGGYLVLRCLDVLSEAGVWQHLKRILQTGRLEIRDAEQSGSGQPSGLQPEAIPVDLKVVLIGEPGVYETLAAEDPQFPQTFKIHAEFDATIPVNKKNLTRYADYVRWLVGHEELLEFSGDAMAAVAEYGARAAGRRDRLITRYSELGDLAREASYLAAAEAVETVERAHVVQAIEARRRRHDLAQELTERDYTAGYMRLSTTGDAIGQANALTVLDTGTLEFGRPCRITCNSGVAVPQRSGLVNIEGLANLSGPIHDKGVMILEGFLLQEFGRDGPLCMQATICFEQLYNGVEGDSASLAQLLALLSSLASVPLHQHLAITGSVNQKGEVQAVSGVNEKIEGFFRVCRARRTAAKSRRQQGVVIPAANAGDLMLEHDVVAAVEKGEFHIYTAADLRDALALFTSQESAEVLARVRATLAEFRAIAG